MCNICKIPKKSQFIYGNGGSTSIIVLTPDKKIYKYFTTILYKESTKLEAKEAIENSKIEIKILQMLRNLTPHIIELYDFAYCKSIPKVFFENCESYNKYLLSKKESTQNCYFIYNKFPSKVNNNMFVAHLEYCESELNKELEIIIKKSTNKIKLFLDRILFQIFFTLEIIKKKYPLFIHNDLFIRNILIKNIINNDKYIRYKINDKYYDVPATGSMIKINDFGLSYINKEINKYESLNCSYKDWFNILYDIYNGNNLGSNSLINLTKNPKKILFIKNYFNNFINIKVIDKIIKNNKKNLLDWNWNLICDDKIKKLLLVKDNKEIFNYFDDKL
jgi:hypothetical protein